MKSTGYTRSKNLHSSCLLRGSHGRLGRAGCRLAGRFQAAWKVSQGLFLPCWGCLWFTEQSAHKPALGRPCLDVLYELFQADTLLHLWEGGSQLPQNEGINPFLVTWVCPASFSHVHVCEIWDIPILQAIVISNMPSSSLQICQGNGKPTATCKHGLGWASTAAELVKVGHDPR